MITIKQEGTKVVVTLDPKLDNGRVAALYWEANSEWFAQMLTERLRDGLYKQIQTIREEEYLRGYADKTKRKPKVTWFSGVLRKLYDN